jgi:UDP-N-acetylglucosamine 2-epimerase
MMAEARTTAARPRVLMVVGTRPEAIKMAPVARALAAREDLLESRLVLTGQHDELVGQVLRAFDLVPELGLLPDLDLAVMREGQDLYDLAQACLQGLRGVARDFRPDLVLVQGDTATVFLSSLVAFFEKVRVGHVESGLRSGNKWAPYPEEMFRRLSDVLADFHFAPTARARDNLLGEGVKGGRVFLTGNTVVDALLAVAGLQRVPGNPQLRRVLEGGNRLVLLTAHRRESFGMRPQGGLRGRSGAGGPGSGDRDPLSRAPESPRHWARPGSFCPGIPGSTSQIPWTTSTWCRPSKRRPSSSRIPVASRRRHPRSGHRSWSSVK